MGRARPGWVTAVAIFHLISGGLTALQGLAVIVTFQSILDVLEQIGFDAGALRGISALPGAILILAGALHIVVGVYLLRLAPWSQIVSIILNTLSLLSSVALAVFAFTERIHSVGIMAAVMAALYGLWIYGLLNPQSSRAFTKNCPTCGQPLDPSWDFCPYCQEQSRAAGDAIVPTVGAAFEAGEAAGGPPQGGYSYPPAPAAPYEQAGTWAQGQQAGASYPGGGTAVAPAAFPSGGWAGAGPAAPAAMPRQDRTQLMHRVPEAMAWLVFQSGPRAGREVQLMSDSVGIGRDPKPGLNDIVLDDPTVSSQHAKIRLQEGQYVLYDLASTNGTFVNGDQVQKQSLQDGDRIRFGQLEMLFMWIQPAGKEAVSPAPPPA